MRYFRLNIDCQLITGKKGAVLYDITGRRIVILDKKAGRILQRTENRKPIKEKAFLIKLHNFYDILVREGLGSYYSNPPHIDQMLLNSPINKLELLGPSPAYKVINWSITARCDQKCCFCPNNLKQPIWQACRSCVRRDNASEHPALFAKSGKLIKQMVELGIWGLHIRGGNPLLEWERLLDILGNTRNYPHLRVGITTPGTGQSINDVLSLYRFPNVQLNIVLNGFDGKDDQCLKDEHSLRLAQYQLLDKLRQYPTAFTIVVMISDKEKVNREAISQHILKRWGTVPAFAEFFKFPENRESEFRFSTIQNGKKYLSLWQNPEDYFHRSQHCVCLHGALEIAVDGAIKPCAGCDHDCGQILNNDLTGALRGDRIYNLWKMSKRDITQCSDCPLGLACADCLAADILGAQHKNIAAGYCPVMQADDLYAKANHLQHNGFLYLLSLDTELELCPT